MKKMKKIQRKSNWRDSMKTKNFEQNIISGSENIERHYETQRTIMEQNLETLKSQSHMNIDLNYLNKNGENFIEIKSNLPHNPKLTFGYQNFDYISNKNQPYNSENLRRKFIEMFETTDFDLNNNWNEIITSIGFLQVWFGYKSVLLPIPYSEFDKEITVNTLYGKRTFTNQDIFNLSLTSCILEWEQCYGFFSQEIKKYILNLDQSDINIKSFWTFID